MSKARQLADNGAATPHRNILINGGMQISQRSVSVTGLGANASPSYSTVDRFGVYSLGSSAGRYTMTQETITDLPSFAKCMKLACTTADTSIAAGEALIPTQIVEGQNLFRTAKGTSGALQWTISFYVKANAAFNYVLDVYENDSSRLASRMFATTTSWVRHEFTIPADTANGTITNDNTASLYLGFILHAGSNFTSGTMNQTTWADITNANRAPGVSSFYSSTNNTFFLTGVQLEVGEAATPFEHKTFAEDLAECQRYCYFHSPSGASVVVQYQGSYRAFQAEFPVTMRAAPSASVGNFSGFSAFGGSSTSTTSFYGYVAKGSTDTNSLTVGNVKIESEL